MDTNVAFVAAVVREENAAVGEAQVIERVRECAGARNVPRRVYFVERLPRTDSGKPRRSALPELVSPTTAALAVDLVSVGAGSGESAFGRILREVEALTDEEAMLREGADGDHR